jgi:hypothetical protein
MVQSNLTTTATHGTPKKWSLFTGGRCSEVPKKYDNSFKATGHDKQQGVYADTV